MYRACKVGRSAFVTTVVVIMGMGITVLGATPPEVYLGKKVPGRGIITNPDGSWSHIRIGNDNGQYVIMRRESTDNGQTWGLFNYVSNLASPYSSIMPVGVDRNGELQAFLIKQRGTGTQPGVDLFLDLYSVYTTNNQTQWSTPDLRYAGYVTEVAQPTITPGGRVLLPFHYFVPPNAQTGRSEISAMWSDSDGVSWASSVSTLTTAITPGFNGGNDGAIEPVVISQPAYGRDWMLIRTQQNYLYEAYSYDSGTTWGPAMASQFASSDSPADYHWLPDGRLMLIWNNARNSPRVNGKGVYSGREALHAAISDDQGLTWRGFREIYLDPYRHTIPLQNAGDHGTAIPVSVQMNDGRVAVMAGQSAGPSQDAQAMIYVDPHWLYETTRSSDFSTSITDWTVFTGTGEPDNNWWRSRVIGPEIIYSPQWPAVAPGQRVLHLNNPTPSAQDGDGAVWNFPMGVEGRITIRMMLTDDTKVADIQLTDRFLDPTDDTSMDVAIFNLRFNDRGEIVGQEQHSITKNIWHDVAIDWDLSASTATILVDDVVITTIPMLFATQTGVSYLRLRSPFVSALDPAGWYIDRVDAVVVDPSAPSSSVPEPGTCSVVLILSSVLSSRYFLCAGGLTRALR